MLFLLACLFVRLFSCGCLLAALACAVLFSFVCVCVRICACMCVFLVCLVVCVILLSHFLALFRSLYGTLPGFAVLSLTDFWLCPVICIADLYSSLSFCALLYI